MEYFYFPKDFNEKIQRAVDYFWNTRDSQFALSGQDQGNRGAVTGGKQLDAFVELLKDILVLNGVKENSIFTNSQLELPGYYRANKKWDVLVVDRHNLLAAIELKSQIGPSFGNNFNNRTEEALGSAVDIWTAYREEVFGIQQQPWVGYFMLLEDCHNSSLPVATKSPHFKVMQEFDNASYKERYEIFCRKLQLERQYSAVCFMTTSRPNERATSFDCPNKQLSFKTFVTSLLRCVTSIGDEGRIHI